MQMVYLHWSIYHTAGTCVVSDEVRVRYRSKHEGHDCDVAHLHMRKEQRQHIAGLLAAGIPFEEVLDAIQLDADNAKVSYMHFITKKDLQNVTRDFNIDRNAPIYKNDADSVAAWITRMKETEGSETLVRYIKFQGQEDDSGLKADDFMLILMSEAQLAGLMQFCGPMKQAALDSTHGTNAYDFQLTTLMGIDEHGEGFPCAFCYSNRVDEFAMRIFLRAVTDALGSKLTDVILMTDDTEVFANAWMAEMGPPAHRLLCTWHVDHAWRKNLGRINGDSLLKATVYRTLRSLLEMTDQSEFTSKLQQFLATCQSTNKTAAFGTYFAKEYAARPQLWAYSYRLGLRVHHNMHLEALHRVLKHVHLQGRKVRRMDKSIAGLMRLMRSKMQDRLLKLHKGKWTRHICAIRERHKKSLMLNAASVVCVTENTTYAVQ